MRIDSRADFFRVLAEVQSYVRRLLGYSPDEPTLESLAGQLEVMRRWTAGGRTPENVERGCLDLDLYAAGDAETSGDAGLDARIQQLAALHRYFAAWPSDARSAHAAKPRAVSSSGSARRRRAARRP